LLDTRGVRLGRPIRHRLLTVAVLGLVTAGLSADALYRAISVTRAQRLERGREAVRDEIDRMAGAVKATHPDFRYQVTAAPQEYCDAGMVPWISGRPGEVPAYSGRDFVIARDGRIVALYMFFDKRP